MVRWAPACALVAAVLLLAGIATTVGLGPAGWIAGLLCAGIINLLLARGLIRTRAAALNPANAVTLVRAMIVCAVAALVVDGFFRPTHTSLLVALAAVALILDAVDGRVARRTGTCTALGARFDMEVDAFAIGVLSVQVSRTFGSWVLLAGLARYLYVAAGFRWRWLSATPPSRPWCKTVAAIQGIVLTVAIADVLPRPLAAITLVVALVLLAESFGRQALWLWQLDRGRTPSPAPSAATVVRLGVTAGAVLLVWAALVLPDRIGDLTPAAFVRLPIEGIVIFALAVVLPGRARTVFAAGIGVLLGIVVLLKALDIGFTAALDRPFDLVTDPGTFGSADGVLRDSVGGLGAVAIEIAVVVAAVGLLLVLALAAVRLAGIGARHRRRSVLAATAAGAVWLVGAVTGLSVAGGPVASSVTAGYGYGKVHQLTSGLRDARAFGTALDAADPMAGVPAADLLTGLRGKDVIIAVVESYGRVAVQDSPMTPEVDAALHANTDSLRAAGFSARSGFLTSPTFGGISWLAHSTMQSGLWIDSQQRYDQLMASGRFTLSDAFRRAGWRTVGDVPANTRNWPEGSSFYHYQQIYDSRNVGYAGPKFSYATMPDQFTLAAFARAELGPGHRPVMAEIDLVSSHTPWTPLPRLVDWDTIGDGSVFDPMPAEGPTPAALWRNTDDVKAAYGQSIVYTLGALTSFVRNAHDDNLVLIVYGDHQPATVVSGTGAGHDVPISIIAHDPAVLASIGSWGWHDGLLPGPTAPVWPMDRFRDRFLTAFS